MEFDSFAELFEKSVLLSQMPEKCDKCGAEVALMFRNVTAQNGPKRGTKMKYYGLQCLGPVRHEYYLGIHNDDSRELFAYSERKFQDPYTNDQLQSAEYREACPHCNSSNQFHAKTCPHWKCEECGTILGNAHNSGCSKTPQEPRTDPEPAKVADTTPKAVSTPTEAPKPDSGQTARAERTQIQQARDKFVRSVGDLGLIMGNTELATMLKSMLGVESVPSPLTPEHWTTCYNLCNEYKTAAEIGGINLDPNALAVMLASGEEVPGTRKIEEYSAAEWKAAAERAMEG